MREDNKNGPHSFTIYSVVIFGFRAVFAYTCTYCPEGLSVERPFLSSAADGWRYYNILLLFV